MCLWRHSVLFGGGSHLHFDGNVEHGGVVVGCGGGSGTVVHGWSSVAAAATGHVFLQEGPVVFDEFFEFGHGTVQGRVEGDPLLLGRNRSLGRNCRAFHHLLAHAVRDLHHVDDGLVGGLVGLADAFLAGFHHLLGGVAGVLETGGNAGSFSADVHTIRIYRSRWR